MNILTFDIEEWSLEKDYFGNHNVKYIEFDKILDDILETLAQNDATATFFCLGKIANDFPNVIKKIAAQGHEIGSHSNAHIWVNKMTPEEFRDDTHEAISALEDLIGTKVRSFRAPAFSIGESNKWALDILVTAGIENDASFFPGVRDFGGFPCFSEQRPCRIDYNGFNINEFPIPLVRLPIISKEIAYSGGGYFRLLPLWFIRNRMVHSDYNMCYFHIADLLSLKTPFMSRNEFEEYFKEPGTLRKRLGRYFKANIGRSRSMENFHKIIQNFQFCSIEDYIKTHHTLPIVKI